MMSTSGAEWQKIFQYGNFSIIAYKSVDILILKRNHERHIYKLDDSTYEYE